MKLVNTISGGKSSAYVAEHYPGDYAVFSLVRIEAPAEKEDRFNCLWMRGKDEATRRVISERIGCDFYGTAEEDGIIYTILDLEQHLGREIKIITGETFDHVIKHSARCLPDPLRRFCTEEMKVRPMFNWWKATIGVPCEFTIGYRKGEERRAVKMLAKCNENGFLERKDIIGKRQCVRKKTGEIFEQNRWGMIEWQKPVFKMIEDIVTYDMVENNWLHGHVRFCKKNNCVICFNQQILLLAMRAKNDPSNLEVLKWASTKEKMNHEKDVWFKEEGVSMDEVMRINEQKSFIDDLNYDEFNECDSGYCGV